MNRGAITALIIIVVVLLAFVLLYQRSAVTQQNAPIPTTSVGGGSGSGSSASVSPSQMPSTTGGSNLQNPSVTPFPTKGVSVSPTTTY